PTSDLHGDFLDERRELVAAPHHWRNPAELHLHANLAARVDVLADVTLTGVAYEPRHRHVLAEFGDLRGDELPDRSIRILQPAVPRRLARLLDLREDVLDELLEVRRARHEIRLAIDLDQRADRVVGGDTVADQPLACGPPGPLGRGRQPSLAENRVRHLEVAARLGERR